MTVSSDLVHAFHQEQNWSALLDICEIACFQVDLLLSV